MRLLLLHKPNKSRFVNILIYSCSAQLMLSYRFYFNVYRKYQYDFCCFFFQDDLPCFALLIDKAILKRNSCFLLWEGLRLFAINKLGSWDVNLVLLKSYLHQLCYLHYCRMSEFSEFSLHVTRSDPYASHWKSLHMQIWL